MGKAHSSCIIADESTSIAQSMPCGVEQCVEVMDPKVCLHNNHGIFFNQSTDMENSCKLQKQYTVVKLVYVAVTFLKWPKYSFSFKDNNLIVAYS